MTEFNESCVSMSFIFEDNAFFFKLILDQPNQTNKQKNTIMCVADLWVKIAKINIPLKMCVS